MVTPWRSACTKKQLLLVQLIILWNIISTAATINVKRISGLKEAEDTTSVTDVKSAAPKRNNPPGAIENFKSGLNKLDPKIEMPSPQRRTQLQENTVLRKTVSKQEKREVTKKIQPKENNKCEASGMKFIGWYDESGRLFDYPGTEMFEDCEYSCCYIHQHHVAQNPDSVDALIFTANKERIAPPARRSKQTWIWFSMHPLTKAETPVWRDQFNWTMTYRLDSDLVMTHIMSETDKSKSMINYDKILTLKDKKLIWVTHACDRGAKRNEYVKILQKYINVDIFAYDGNCLVPGMMGVNNYYPTMFERYKFAIAFEKHLCKDYVTDMFGKILKYNIVPIVRGQANYSYFTPDNSYIDTQDYKSIEELGNYLQYLDSNDTAYLQYLRHKAGYRFSCFSLKTRKSSYCELCKKLHNLSAHAKTIQDINTLMSQCSNPNDLREHNQ